MKKVYYNRLIAERKDLSASERIVYSFLVYACVCECEDVWDKETGEFDVSNINELEYLEIPQYLLGEKGYISISNVARSTNISKATISRTIKHLVELGIIQGQMVLNERLYLNGYFALSEKKLNGELLIFFSMLSKIGGEKKIIYAKREKLAQLYGVDETNVREYLHRLKELGFIERNKYNNIILKT